MHVIQIECPRCHRGLSLKGRDKLGKKGKCPACGHAFLLAEQAEPEVLLELADAESPAGTSVPWAPGDPAPGGGGRAAAAVASSPQPDGAPLIAVNAPSGGLDRLKEIKRRNAKRRNRTLFFSALVLLAVGGVVFAVLPALRDAMAPVAGGTTTTPESSATASNAAASLSTKALWERERLSANAQLVEPFRPTEGDPIRLLMVPSGVNVVFHLRPAQLWSNEAAFQELRASLTEGVVAALEKKIKEICRREPAEIEEALIVLILGAGGTPPETACVVRLKEEAKLSDLIEEFRGRRLSEDGLRITVAEPYAYLVRDAKTFAICPADSAEELREWYDTPNTYAAQGVFELLDTTDRQRLFTTLFEVDDVRLHDEQIFPEAGRDLFRRFIDWFGEDVQTVCWSLHLEDQLHSEMKLRPRSSAGARVVTADRLAADLHDRLRQTPHDLVWAVERMSPRTAGFRDIISRFPAMIEAFRQATVPSLGVNELTLTTVLPAKAAPNLALGALLTWDESTRTNFSAEQPVVAAVAAAAAPQELPATVAERLLLPVDAEFERTPLQDALKYITGEIQVGLEIDGDALKNSGYTQNMPQTFKLGRVSAKRALHEILKQYDGKGKEDDRMVISIDEEAKKIIVLTMKFAKDQNKTPYPTD